MSAQALLIRDLDRDHGGRASRPGRRREDDDDLILDCERSREDLTYDDTFNRDDSAAGSAELDGTSLLSGRSKHVRMACADGHIG